MHRITEFDIDVVHHESWKFIYFGVKGQGYEAQKHVCVGLQKYRDVDVCCWVFLASHPRVRSC